MVLGIPRSGTSCVAGVLHRLGVDMGAGHFQPNDKFNPRGYYEDLRWRLANQRLTGRGYSLRGATIKAIGKKQRTIYRRLAKECKNKAHWGIKDPWLCFVGQFIWPILRNQRIEVTLIAVHRSLDASVASVGRHIGASYKSKRGKAKQIVETWTQGFEARLKEFDGPIHHVQYEKLVNRPHAQIEALATFCLPTSRLNGRIAKIALWVAPELKHF